MRSAISPTSTLTCLRSCRPSRRPTTRPFSRRTAARPRRSRATLRRVHGPTSGAPSSTRMARSCSRRPQRATRCFTSRRWCKAAAGMRRSGEGEKGNVRGERRRGSIVSTGGSKKREYSSLRKRHGALLYLGEGQFPGPNVTMDHRPEPPKHKSYHDPRAM